MRNHEVTTVQELLDENGELREPGWSRRMVQQYHRSQVKAPGFRIKEWDYYLVLNQEFAAAFTISDDGYIGLQSVSILNFKEGWEHTNTVLNPFPMGRMKLPESSVKGHAAYKDKNLQIYFLVKKGNRRLVCKWKNFYQGKTFQCDITLEQPEMDTMVIATPWKKKHAFYYNQKINCMPASGTMTFDGKTYTFSPQTDYGTLDWGRGVWTYDNMWYWGSANATVNGKPFGFNIGYGFGDTSAATENILFYDGVGHKLDDVTFHIPEDDYLAPWTFTSSDGRFEMDFKPVLDRAAKTSAVLIVTDQHQVFGHLSGRAVLDDGTVLELKDVMCFAEQVHNRY
ncbi:DUF2804 domain-containing protein [Hespellia stercorisuis]|uniref:DUF2804 domain-containing protein n=1 Tax=Hespellia stercorisuis DSM 15480 TaxID=1121950 RepID=A0A1M6PJ91_9FIRM|nr:DUF2804 domain-containing protein [Hespellia stercorisuis]SHK07999.1 Protein of unknown function [Hespellia stercorisuis DSM 15480]